jgi:hypothetical protein
MSANFRVAEGKREKKRETTTKEKRGRGEEMGRNGRAVFQRGRFAGYRVTVSHPSPSREFPIQRASIGRANSVPAINENH